MNLVALFASVVIAVCEQSQTTIPVPAQGQTPKWSFSHFEIVLHVTDIRHSVNFYRNMLGFRLDHYLVGSAKETKELSDSDGEPYAATLFAGDQEITFQRNSGEVKLPATGARYHFEVSDISAFYSFLISRGIEVHRLIKTIKGEPFLFCIYDPDGHWLFFHGPINNPKPAA